MLRNILVIEDNPDICDLVSLHLRDSGYSVEVQMDGEKGLARAMSGEFQLVILDLHADSKVLRGRQNCRPGNRGR